MRRKISCELISALDGGPVTCYVLYISVVTRCEMKWSIFVCLIVCLARYCDAGALRCTPGVLDPSCTEEMKENTQETSASQNTEAQCLSGTEWESNCHYCRCSDTGIAECLKMESCDMGLFAEPALCKPNTTFQRDCNTCVCLENGLGLCTLDYCRRSNNIKETLELTEEVKSEKDQGEKTETHVLVIPMQYYGDGANFLEINHGMLKRSTICKPGEEFMRECNPCKCANDGLSYSCTRNECLEVDMNKEVEVFMANEGRDHIERHTVCRAHDTFKIACNTCRCNALGTDYSCTNEPCPLPPDVEVFDEFERGRSKENATKSQVCVANRMFVKDCNTCWCNEDGTSYVCTRRTCVPLLPDEEPDLGGIPAEDLRVTLKECRPDEVFELDCNMCRCNPDGKSYSCTRRACAESELDKNATVSRKVRSITTEAPKACQPGQEFRMDCNKCLCDNKGQDFSCTRNDCNAVNNHEVRRRRDAPVPRVSEPIEMKCVAGSVFDRECNVCRCTADGNHATCTIKRCKQDNELDSEVKPTESDPGFRCNPGEQFKRECNDCTCSADGRSVFCTLRLCDETMASGI